MVENKYEIQDLINASAQQKPIDFSNAFGDLIIDKLNDAVNTKKMELAQTMFAPAVESPEEVEDEELEDNSEEEIDGEVAQRYRKGTSWRC